MSYGDQSIDEFLDALASESVTPAGGTAAAVVGAIGASLCEMACVHSLGGEEDAAAATALADVRDRLGTQRSTLMGHARADAEVVERLFAPDADRTDQSEVARATGVPLSIAEASLAVVELSVTVSEEGDSDATADAEMGAVLAAGALRAAVLAVRHNVPLIEDSSLVEEMERRAAELEVAVERALEQAVGDAGSAQA